METDKPSLLLVDRRILHRERIKLRLDTVYTVTDYALLADACRHARLHPPAAMVLCEDQARGEDFYFLQTLRFERTFRTLPIIIVLAEENPAQAARALHAGATACIAKPYLPSALVALISAAISKRCELAWDALPALPAAALKTSVQLFDDAAARLASGQPIAYAEISTACAPLAEAINAGDIKNLLDGVKAHDNYAYAHSLRVAVFLAVFGRNIGLTAPEQAILSAGGLLLDVGKSLISPLLLNKHGRLTDADTIVMHGHVNAATKLLQNSPGLPEGVRIIAAQHHEKLDGSGYPHALPGAKLNELARMAAIADIFAGLTDRRVYKPAISPDAAFTLMANEMSMQLDMNLLRCFRQIIHDTYILEAPEHAAV